MDAEHGLLEPGKLERLLTSHGIGREFIDFSGQLVRIPLANRLRILACMGIQVTDEEALDALLHSRARPQGEVLAERHPLAEAGMPVELTLLFPGTVPQQRCSWRVQLEDGSSREGQFEPTGLPLSPGEEAGPQARLLSLEALPAGYHQLELQGEDWHDSAELIVAPAQIWQPEDLGNNQKMWGISVQLYSLRSADNWGMGDFRDLRELCRHAAAAGADFILLNPLHCPDLRAPDNASPYSPDDRRFLNPWYIHLPDCEDFYCEAVRALLASRAFSEALTQARSSELVEYATVVSLKLQVLCLMYESFSRRPVTNSLRSDFQQFLAEGAQVLGDFAAFQAGRFAVEEGLLTDARFHSWLQWLAMRQLRECQQQCRSDGMRIGLVQDVAVGSHAEGCEVQTSLSQYCLQARIGAPPDNFNPDGQNWGLPPLLPDALQANGARHFRQLLWANMRGCGALRIDHVMSLMRLWWCPDEDSNAAGAYVYYPVDLLFAILRLESQRHQCLVIGEDLGVVPPEIRDHLEASAIFSNSLFYFEKYDGWHFRKAEDYAPRTLAMIANHDVPPLACWWSEDDIVLRRRIGLIAEEQTFHDDIRWRRGEKGQILQWLQDQALLPPQWQVTEVTRALDDSLKTALAAACGRFAALLVSVQLDDLAGATTPVNIPGTHCEYANWRRKLPQEVDMVFRTGTAVNMMKALHLGRQG